MKAVIKDYLRRLLLIILGSICCALALNLFLADNHISAGGFSGLIIALNYFFYLPVGTSVLVLSVPLLIWAVFVKGWRFALNTTLTLVIYSALVDGTSSFLKSTTDNLLLAAICGGALTGLSSVLFLKADSSSGGTDLLARILIVKQPNLSLGTMFLFIDGFVVIFSAVVRQNPELGIYAVISLASCSYVNDKLIHGLNQAEIYYIIPASDPFPIADAILTQLGRGVTKLQGEGMYSQQPRCVLMAVVKPRQSHQLKTIVKSIDPEAFVFRCQASEVVGKGFIDVDASAGKHK